MKKVVTALLAAATIALATMATSARRGALVGPGADIWWCRCWRSCRQRTGGTLLLSVRLLRSVPLWTVRLAHLLERISLGTRLLLSTSARSNVSNQRRRPLAGRRRSFDLA